MTVCLIYSTHPSPEQARQTADALLNEQLATCCNLLPGMESHYVWEGRRTQANETIMLSKTTEAAAEAAVARIRALHPNDCPAILQWPVSGGNPAFLDWVTESVKSSR